MQFLQQIDTSIIFCMDFIIHPMLLQLQLRMILLMVMKMDYFGAITEIIIAFGGLFFSIFDIILDFVECLLM